MYKDVLDIKEAFLEYENVDFLNVSFSKSPKLHFSQGVNPWFWSKTRIFSVFFPLILRLEIMFNDVLDNKRSPSFL